VAALAYNDLVALAIQAGLPPDKAQTAAAIALAESSGRPDALNDNPGTHDYSVGLWQINLFGDLARSRPSAAALKDAQTNAITMARMSGNGANFGAWSAYRNGAYKAFLPGGPGAASTVVQTASRVAVTPVNWLSTLAGQMAGGDVVQLVIRGSLITLGLIILVLGFAILTKQGDKLKVAVKAGARVAML
jgi:hypothetical protein